MSEASVNTLPPPAVDPSSIAGNLAVSDMAADKWMDSLNGEFVTNGESVGFENKPKNPDKPSEDAAYVYADDNGRLYLGLFDGMGHYGSGDLMARTARDVYHGYASANQNLVDPETMFDDFYEDAVEKIVAIDNASTKPEKGAGTTGFTGVVMEVEGKKRFIGAAVGDSLGYVVRVNGDIVQLNKEETLRQDMLDRGISLEKADTKGRHVTNAISRVFGGVEQNFDIELFDGDVIVLTSDGITGDSADQRLSGGASNEDVIRQVALDRTLTPKEKSQKLIELATKKDDRTAIFVEIGDSWIDKFTSEDLSSDMEQLRKEMLKGIGSVAVEGEMEPTVDLEPKTRDERLFTPLLDLDGSSESDSSDNLYDLLTKKGDDSELLSFYTEKEKQRLNKDYQKAGFAERSRVTEESLDSASRQLAGLRSKDKVINDTLTVYQEKTGVWGKDLLKAMRCDAELRMVIGKRLLDAVNAYPFATRMGIMLKSPDAPGYDEAPDDMTSKEYIALLMLAMVDGSYKENTSDLIEKDKFGSVSLGFHRKEARTVFDRYSDLIDKI